MGTDGGCAAAATLHSDNFEPRPVGGTTLLEASVEYRFRVWRALEMALFVDAAVVGEGDVTTLAQGTSAITPGFGFRYATPVGPIRVDLGVKPLIAENLPIVTEVVGPDGVSRIVPLGVDEGVRSARGQARAHVQEPAQAG